MTAYGDVRLLGSPRAVGSPRAGGNARAMDHPRAIDLPRTLGNRRPVGGRQVTGRRAKGQPTAAPEARASRRRLSSPSRARQRAHPVGRLMATVLLTFLIGLIYLAQTIQIAATNYEVEQLAAQRDDLGRQVQTVEASLLRWGAEPMVVERAQRLGFDILTGRVRIAAR